MDHAPPLVPELDVSDLARSLAFYLETLGFTCRFRRPEEGFAYLVHEGAHLMLQAAEGPGRHFRTAPLEPPFGRGINLQIAVSDVDALHARVVRSGLPIVIPLEERWYRQDETEAGNRQFVMADPDGYLLRLFHDLGRRPTGASPVHAPQDLSRGQKEGSGREHAQRIDPFDRDSTARSPRTSPEEPSPVGGRGQGEGGLTARHRASGLDRNDDIRETRSNDRYRPKNGLFAV